MKLIIHDLDQKHNEKLQEKFDGENIHIVSDNGSIKQCIGCFGCWVKTPGVCLIKDGYESIGALNGKCDEIIIISECVFGTYSPFVRNVLDRSLSYVHPDFTKRNNEIHHKKRYDNSPKTTVYFYGDANEEEKETAKKIVFANALNFDGVVKRVEFFNSFEEVFI